MAWHDVLLQASAAGQGRAVIRLLESALARQTDDWRWRFLLAEARLRTGDYAIAEKLLREIEVAAPADASTLPVAEGEHDPGETASPSLFSGVSYGSGAAHGAGAAFARRNRHSFEIRQVMQQIAAGLNGVAAIASAQFIFPTYEEYQPQRYLPRNPAEAADAALVMRSILAEQSGRGAEFVTELRGSSAKLPRAERVARLALVQAPDPLLEELTAESTTPSGDEAVNAVCLEVTLDLGKSMTPVLGGADVDTTKLISLMKAFLPREKHPDTLLLGKMQLSRLWKRAGRDKEAGDVAREALGEWTTLPADDRYEIFEFALENGDPEHAEAVLAAMADDHRRAGAAFADYVLVSEQVRLASGFAVQKAGDTRVARYLTAAVRDSYDFASANLSHLALMESRSAFHQAQEFPYGSRIIGEGRLETWSEAFGIASQQGQVAALNTAFAEDARQLPPAQSVQARLAGICFSWWANDRDAAIRAALDLAAAHHDDELDLLAGSMLAEVGRYAEARKMFEQISASHREIAADKTVRLLNLARAQKDNDGARALALQLVAFPLSSSDRSVLQGILTELDLKGHATELVDKQRAKEQGAYYSGKMGSVQQLQREVQARDSSAAVELARAILARVSPLGNSSAERFPRRSAIDALARFKVLTDYTGPLETQLAAEPKSMETLLRLAEALEHADPARSVELYRRAVDLAPDDLSLQIHLGNVLANSRRADEAVLVWEAAFAKDPEAILTVEFYPIFSGFKAAGAMDRLGAVLLKAPPQGNPLENLAFGFRDASNWYQQVATAVRDEKKLPEAIDLWKASLARARAEKTSAYVESSTLPLLVPALVEAGRQDEAEEELEDYFFPAPPPRPALGYVVRSVQRNWTELTFGSGGREEPRGIAVMRLAQPAGALDLLRAKAVAVAAAHPEDPDRLLVLLIDSLRRDPTQLEALRKEFDDVIGSAPSPDGSGTPKRLEAAGPGIAVSLPNPWNPTTGSILRAIAQVLAEWPEGRPLALHVYETTPDIRAVSPGWIKLHRAEIALSIPDKDAACRALREWLSGGDRNPSVLGRIDEEQQLSAVDLMSRAGMNGEAVALLKKIQATGDMQNRSDLKKRLEELTSRLKAGAGGD
jgi:tetratricopeptide (TPR) repeat protein